MHPVIVMGYAMQMVSNLVSAHAATVVLVDGENIPQALAGQIIKETRHYGRAVVQRVYGNVTRLPAWDAVAGFEMVHTGHAKNGADMRICIDALDLAARGGVGRVVIASSDRDFTHLAQYLRARGVAVVGMGEAKTHEAFRKACSQFVELGGVVKSVPAPKPAAAPPVIDITQRQIVALIKAEGEAGLAVSTLGAVLRAKEIYVKKFGYSGWGKYLSAFPDIFRLEDPVSSSYRVWLK